MDEVGNSDHVDAFFRTAGTGNSSGNERYTASIDDDTILHVAAVSNVGRIRESNEDNFLIQSSTDRYTLTVVCDGMSGHNAGEIASHETCTIFGERHYADNGRPRDLGDVAQDAVNHIKILSEENINKSGMGTTVIAARFLPNYLLQYVLAGDSRLYRVRENAIEQLTKDQKNERFLLNSIQERNFKRDMTQQEETTYHHGDVYLLCSDGLSGMLPDEEMLRIIQEKYKEKGDDLAVAHALVDAANTDGGKDNITAVLVRVEEVPLEKIIEKGMNAVSQKDWKLLTRLVIKYGIQFANSNSSEGYFLIAVYSQHKNNMRQARTYYKQAAELGHPKQ